VADDLVVTAEHCLDFVSAESVRIVFGYYYVNAGVLSAQPSDVYPVESIVLRASDLGEDELDFAWLRLARSAGPAHEPVSTFGRDPHLAIGDGLLSVSAGGGVPLKVDTGVRVVDFEEGRFVAEADTFRGSSGGGAFTPGGELVGLFVRGLSDFESSDAGCMVTRRHASAGAGEQFTYAYRAVEAFCDIEPTHLLCQNACGERCSDDAPAMTTPREPSCAVAVPRRAMPAGPMAGLLAFLLAFFARRPRCSPVR
jgi:hypothetical protein